MKETKQSDTVNQDIKTLIANLQENSNEIIIAYQNSITQATDLIIELADLKGSIDTNTQHALVNLVDLKKGLGKFCIEN